MDRFKFRLVAALTVSAAFGAVRGTPLSPKNIEAAARVESITVPVPGEFFSAMDKARPVAWGQVLRTATAPATDSRTQIALMLGTLVADGYVAVEAQDSQSVKNVGKEILALARRLNVSQSALARANSINDFADGNDWGALREELEATQNEVKLDMAEQDDDELVTLVTVGAWLRGMDLASTVAEADYDESLAMLIRQPAIADYLIAEIDQLPGEKQVDPLVAAARGSLVVCREAMNAPVPDPAAIATLRQTASGVVHQISGTSPSSPAAPPPPTPTPTPVEPVPES